MFTMFTLLDTDYNGIKVVAVHVPDGLPPFPGVAHGDRCVIAQLPRLILVQRVGGVRDHRKVKEPNFNDYILWRIPWQVSGYNCRVRFSHTVFMHIEVISAES